MGSGRRTSGHAAHAVGATLLAGILTYGLLALVSWTVDDSQFDQFSVFWSLALIIGFGFFLPVEQEAARLGRGSLPPEAVAGAGLRAAAELAVLVSVLLLLASPLLITVLHLPPAMVACCVAIVIASAVQFASRGALLVENRHTAFSNTLIADTVLRIVLLGAVAVVVVVWGVPTPSLWYALALPVAIIGAHVWALPPLRSWSRPDAALMRRFRSAMLLLIVMSMCAQVMVNAGPVVIQALEPSTGLAGDFQASSTLARIPLAIVTPIQAMLVGPLAAVALSGQMARLAGMMVRIAAVTAVLAAVGAVLGYLLGPWAVDLVFGPGRALPALDMALLVAGVIIHVALIIFTQALIASGRHRRGVVVWCAAVVVAVAAFLATLGAWGPATAIEIGFGVGSLAGVVIALSSLLSVRRTAQTTA